MDNTFRAGDLKALQRKFANFRALLDKNNEVLHIISDLEEKSRGEFLFDTEYIRSTLSELRSAVSETVDCLDALGGGRSGTLRERLAAIDARLDGILPGNRSLEKDAFTVPFSRLGADRVCSVGGKNAHLAEIRSKLGLPTPDGFAITAWAYKRFLEENDLQGRIADRISALDVRRYEDLIRAGEEIRDMVLSCSVPEDLALDIERSYAELTRRSGSGRIAVRSSAVGEDALLSFAGQYTTFLNVDGENLLDLYRQVIADKFTPRAIYYFLSHNLLESDLAMSVCCVTMVDAVASGVIYSRDPLHPKNGSMVVNSVFGLGPYLVGGKLTPDVFRVSREDGSVVESKIARKPVRLTLQETGGVLEEAVSESEWEKPSIEEGGLRLLAEYAARIEDHFGAPQDIEWSVDRHGRLFLLQARPLRVLEDESPGELPDLSALETLATGGTTVYPGAGGGRVFQVASSRDLQNVPEDAVLVAPHSFPGLVSAMDKASALVTEVGGVASHMATLARERRLPTLVGVQNATGLTAGEMVTVDATEPAIYSGLHPDLIEARRPQSQLFERTAIFDLLDRILSCVAPLNLICPADPSFSPEHCQTFHDITRFAHQRAMEEMFSSAKALEKESPLGLDLRSTIPLPVRLLYLDRDVSDSKGKTWVGDTEIASTPMKAFWSGMKEEGWPSPKREIDAKGFMSVLATHMIKGQRQEFSENSFAILSLEYMLLNLRLGYHFSTVEAMCTQDPNRNYIRMQYKEGGATLERRIRRIALISDILLELGFDCARKGDFLNAFLAHQSPKATLEKLRLLGRISLMTKQLDMALYDDAVTQWYTADFMRKLGLKKASERGDDG